MKNNYEYVGSMKFGAFVDITDPCYPCDGNCNIVKYPIRSGKYECYIRYGDGESWKRIAEIAIIKKNYNKYLDNNVWDEIGKVGVDSGLCGFFSDKIDYTHEEWDNFCDRLEIGEAKKSWWVNFDNGFFSESGWGDGYYPVYRYVDEAKQTVGLKIVFIFDDEE